MRQRMKYFAAVAATLVLFPIAASAENWVQMGQTDLYTFYLDADSIVDMNDGYVGYTIRTDYFSVQTDSAGSYDRAFYVMKVNCQARTAQELEAHYWLGNAIVDQSTSGDLLSIQPGSTAEAEANYVCGR